MSDCRQSVSRPTRSPPSPRAVSASAYGSASSTRAPRAWRLLDSALEGEITDHLGYDKHAPAGKNGGNSGNGTRGKTVLTEVGPVEISVPRDRDGTFEPKIVRKWQKRLSGVDEMGISLSAKGLTTGEVQAHVAEVYGADVSKQTIGRSRSARPAANPTPT